MSYQYPRTHRFKLTIECELESESCSEEQDKLVRAAAQGPLKNKLSALMSQHLCDLDATINFVSNHENHDFTFTFNLVDCGPEYRKDNEIRVQHAYTIGNL